MAINFFNGDFPLKLKNKNQLKNWIKNTITTENKKLNTINFIFCTDQYLLEINLGYLKHDTYTDIITFQYHTSEEPIIGDIFISIPRVTENAKIFNQSFEDELHRNLIHGTLHLLGYTDKSKTDKALMTSKEDYYLSLRSTK
jgi:rRNA maturation RNase YbeY